MTCSLRNFIGGSFVDGGVPFDIHDPAIGRVHAIKRMKRMRRWSMGG